MTESQIWITIGVICLILLAAELRVWVLRWLDWRQARRYLEGHDK